MKIISSKEGYRYFAPYYKKFHQHLDSFDWEISKDILFSKINSYYKKNQKIIIADLGCGDGRILKRVETYLVNNNLNNYTFYAFDISEQMIKIARKKIKSNVNFTIINLEKEKIYIQADIIYAFFLLVHIKDLDFLFSNVCSSLKDKGIFIFNNIEQKKGFQLPFFKEETYIEFFNNSDNKVINCIQKYFKYYEKIKTEYSTIFICEK